MATLLPYIFALIYCTHLAFVHESTSTPDDEGQEVLFFFLVSILYIHACIIFEPRMKLCMANLIRPIYLIKHVKLFTLNLLISC
jgi:hypothetical protein